jgi:predicted nucleic acid-binding protein
MIYLDVNVLQYWLVADPNFGDRAKEILKKYRDMVTSALTIWILFILNPNNEEIILEAVEAVDISVTPLTIQDLRDAVILSGSLGLDVEDAIHLATMKRLEINKIASNDKDFDKISWIGRVF